MGYSIGIRPRSEVLAREMLSFMSANYRSWPTVEGGGGGQYVSDPTDDLDYDRAKGAIGLNYGSVSGWEREYAYVLTRWMAIRIGKRRSLFRKGSVTPNRFKKPVPFMVYDGYDCWPILVVSGDDQLAQIPSSARWCATDGLGMKAEPHREITNVLFELQQVDVEGVLEKAGELVGPAPKDRGESHSDWVERRERAILDLCRKQFESARSVLSEEMKRLNRLWESERRPA